MYCKYNNVVYYLEFHYLKTNFCVSFHPSTVHRNLKSALHYLSVQSEKFRQIEAQHQSHLLGSTLGHSRQMVVMQDTMQKVQNNWCIDAFYYGTPLKVLKVSELYPLS